MRVYQKVDLEQRFLEKVFYLPTGCWVWLGMLDKAGYGRIRDANGRAGESAYAHRVSYEIFNGPIPDGKEVDHLCRQRWCVSPQCLDAVTHQINTIRGPSRNMQIHLSTTCGRGHERNEANIYWQRPGVWQCKECRAIRKRGYKEKAFANALRAD